MKRELTILFSGLILVLLGFIDGLFDLSVSMGFIVFYSCLWLQQAILYLMVNTLLNQDKSIKGWAVIVFKFCSITSLVLFGTWIYGQYIQLKQYV